MNTCAPSVRVSILAISLAVPLLCGPAMAQDVAPKPTPASPMLVTLTDGSRIVCTLGIDRIPVRTSYSSFEIPLVKIEKLEYDAKTKVAVLLLANGDRLQGEILLEKISMRAAFGNFDIPLPVLQQLENTARPSPKENRAADDQQSRAKCINNLRLFDHAKEVLTIKNGLTEGAPVTLDQLDPYIDGDIKNLRCPAGGAYKVNPVDKAPECSIHGAFQAE